MSKLSGKYRAPLLRNILLQGVAVFFSLLIPDTGGILRVVLLAVVVYWLGVLMVVLRRPAKPTKGDLVLASIGFAILLPVVAAVMMVVSRVLGIPLM